MYCQPLSRAAEECITLRIRNRRLSRRLRWLQQLHGSDTTTPQGGGPGGGSASRPTGHLTSDDDGLGSSGDSSGVEGSIGDWGNGSGTDGGEDSRQGDVSQMRDQALCPAYRPPKTPYTQTRPQSAGGNSGKGGGAGRLPQTPGLGAATQRKAMNYALGMGNGQENCPAENLLRDAFVPAAARAEMGSGGRDSGTKPGRPAISVMQGVSAWAPGGGGGVRVSSALGKVGHQGSGGVALRSSISRPSTAARAGGGTPRLSRVVTPVGFTGTDRAVGNGGVDHSDGGSGQSALDLLIGGLEVRVRRRD